MFGSFHANKFETVAYINCCNYTTEIENCTKKIPMLV